MLSDRYEAVEPLGSTGAGELYRAADPRTGRPVLLRVLPAGPYSPPPVEHPSIRVVLDTFETEGRRVLVEEAVEGEALARVLERVEDVPMDERVRWIVSLAQALQTAHEAGVTHGDLSADWITIGSEGTPKLSGLGIGPLLGRDDLDEAADAFLFGALACELVTGSPPFPGRTAFQALLDEEHGLPLSADVPGEIFAALILLLAAEPEMRPMGLLSLANPDLEPLAEAVPTQERAPAAERMDRDLPPPLYEKPPLYDENVQFTVYQPRAVASGQWSRLLFFAHLDALPGDADEEAEDPLDRVEETARQLLGEQAASFRESVQDSLAALPREGEVTVEPVMEGVRFNPPSVRFLWLESVHWREFRLRPSRELSGSTARGRIVVRHGALLLAEIPLRLAVDRPESVEPPALRRQTARAYQSIFPSYSHDDAWIVEQAERHARALGNTYLRDVVTLRSGERWNDRLRELIEQADVFQLFWSTRSMASEYVEQEWRHALGLRRPNFVRPLHWEKPLPEDPERGLPPEELRALHFHFLGSVAVEEEGGGASPSSSLRRRSDRRAPPHEGAREGDPGGGAEDDGYVKLGKRPPAYEDGRDEAPGRPAAVPRRSGARPTAPPPAAAGPVPDLAPVLAYARRAAMVLVVVLAGFWALPMLERAPGGSAERDGPSLPGSGPEPLVTVQASSEARDVETPLNPEELRLIEEKLTDGETQLVIAVHGLEAGSRVEQTSIAFDVQALQVRDQLLGLGVPEERFRFVDYGSRRPVCDEPTEVCRRANQRVEIIALQPGGRQPSMREASED